MQLLVIESDPTQAEIYELSLAEHFSITTVPNFSEAKAQLQNNTFHVVISDWTIGDSHLSAISDVTEQTGPGSLPVLVVVTEDSRESSMIEAFNNGVSYYITKPYKVIQFTEMIVSLKTQLTIIDQMRHDNEQITATTRTAISQSAIYGSGMEIISKLNSARNESDMAKLILRALRLNGIHCAMAFYSGDKTLCLDTDLAPCDETVEKVFSVLRDQGRIYRFGRRLMINDENVSLLVKHVTNDDNILHDAILDMGAKLVPAINTRYVSLMQEQALLDTHNDIQHALKRMHENVLNLSKEKREIIQSVSVAIQQSFHSLEMSEAQEQFFIDLVEKELQAREENSDLIDLDAMMSGISARLTERVASLTESQEDEPPSEYLDVEFF